MQDTIKINGIEIYQPDEDLQNSFETTFTSDSSRAQSGVDHFTPMFTVEQFTYTATDIPIKEASILLQQIAKGNIFILHYFSPYYGVWRDDEFRVGRGSCVVGSVKKGEEKISSITFNMTGRNPI